MTAVDAMKILAAADIHGNHQVYDWLVELVAGVIAVGLVMEM